MEKCFLKTATWNIESLAAQLDDTDFTTKLSNFDIISLVEIWLQYGQNVDIPGFLFIFNVEENCTIDHVEVQVK